METITLSIRNCHRAKTVRKSTEPNGTDYEFGFRAIQNHQGFMGCTFSHLATNGEEKIEISDRELSQWVAVEWKYVINLECLWEAGVRAFQGTSHTPETRAAQYIREYETELQEDLSGMPENERPVYVEKYQSWVATLFEKHSRIASAMIVGPAKFPSRRNQNASSSYDNAYNEFRQWREKYLNGVERRIEEAKPQEQKDDEAFARIKKDILGTAATILDIDINNAPYYRSAFVTNLYSRLSTVAKNSSPELFGRVIDYIKEVNEKLIAKGGKPIFTARHKVWKLAEETATHKQAEMAMRDKENVSIEFDGGSIIKNYAENRLQIHHDEKPPYEIISALKKEGWRWSRMNNCWQRQLTDNAYHSAARIIIGVKFEDDDRRREFVKKIKSA